MKELENVMIKLEKVTKKKEQMDNQIKLLKQKEKKLKRSAETKRKVRKGGVFEAFEREITGMQEETKVNEKTGQSYYIVKCIIEKDKVNNNINLNNDMLAQAKIVVDEKRVLTYLLEKINLWD